MERVHRQAWQEAAERAKIRRVPDDAGLPDKSGLDKSPGNKSGFDTYGNMPKPDLISPGCTYGRMSNPDLIQPGLNKSGLDMSPGNKSGLDMSPGNKSGFCMSNPDINTRVICSTRT